MKDEELLAAAAPAPTGLSDADLMAMPPQSDRDITDADRAVIAQTSLGRVMDAAGEGAKHGWGGRPVGLSEDARLALTGASGNPVKDALTLPFRAFNGAIVVPAMTVLDGAMRAFGGASGAVAGGTGQVAKEAGMPEADANRLTRDMLRAAETIGIVAGAAPYIPQTRAARVVEAERQPVPKTGGIEPIKPAPKELLIDAPIEASTPTPLLDAVKAGAPVDEVLAAAVRTREGEFAGNVNLGRIAMTDDTAAVYRDMAAGAPERRIITHAETEATARAMGITPEEATRLKLVDGRLAAENTAVRQLVLEASSNVHKLKEAAKSGNEADVAAFLEAVDMQPKLFDLLQNRTAEAGRTLSAMRITVAEGADMAKATAQMIKDYGGKKNVDEMIKALDKLETPEQVASFLRGAKKAGWKDMALEGWRAMLLSGPTTQIRNLIGNSLNLAITVPESAIAGAIGGARRAVGGEGGVYAGEAVQRSFGIASAVPDAARIWWRAIKDENFAPAASQVEAVYPRAIPGVGGQVIRTPFRVLNAFDQAFRTLASEAEIRAQALRLASGEGLTGQRLTNRVTELIRDPTPELKELGYKAGTDVTFQTPLTGFMAKLDSARRDSVVAQFIVPFLRTPSNIIWQAFGERTPIGLLSKEVRANLSGRNGAAARDGQAARLAMGGMIGYTFFQLAEQGLLTGTAPRDANERNMMIMEGRPPQSVKIGDFWYEYTATDPLGSIIALAADAREMWDKVGTKEQDQIAVMLGMSISRQVLDKSWARGPSDLLDAITDPSRYGDKWIQGQASSIVPGFLRQIARAEDPVIRDIRSVMDAIKAGIPGQTRDLPAQRDIFGNERRRLDKLGPDMASPITMSRETEDPVIQELSRLRVYPAPVDRVVQGIELNAKQYEQLAIISGLNVRNALDALIPAIVASDETDSPIPDGVRQELVVNAVRRARDQARKAFMAQNPDLLLQAMQFRLEQMQ